MQHFARQLRLLLILMFLGAFGMHAQFDSTIQGIVTDNTRSLIPGAKVTVTNVATGVVRTAETPDDGFYRVLSLAPGTYRVAVHKPGFADAVRDHFGVDDEDCEVRLRGFHGTPGQVAMWVLQHFSAGHCPFIDQVLIDRDFSGAF